MSCVCVYVYRWLRQMTGRQKVIFFRQHFSSQQTTCGIQEVFTPSYSTQIAKANGGTTCFSSIRDAAIYNTVLKVALSLGQLFHSVIHSDIFTLHEELYNSKWPPNTARNFPVRLNIKLGSSFIRYITVKFLDSVRKVLSIFLWPSFTL